MSILLRRVSTNKSPCQGIPRGDRFAGSCSICVLLGWLCPAQSSRTRCSGLRTTSQRSCHLRRGRPAFLGVARSQCLQHAVLLLGTRRPIPRPITAARVCRRCHERACCSWRLQTHVTRTIFCMTALLGRVRRSCRLDGRSSLGRWWRSRDACIRRWRNRVVSQPSRALSIGVGARGGSSFQRLPTAEKTPVTGTCHARSLCLLVRLCGLQSALLQGLQQVHSLFALHLHGLEGVGQRPFRLALWTIVGRHLVGIVVVDLVERIAPGAQCLCLVVLHSPSSVVW